jgi:hypothetical protein
MPAGAAGEMDQAKAALPNTGPNTRAPQLSKNAIEFTVPLLLSEWLLLLLLLLCCCCGHV